MHYEFDFHNLIDLDRRFVRTMPNDDLHLIEPQRKQGTQWLYLIPVVYIELRFRKVSICLTELE